jgi:hypothetical protein
MGISTMTFWLTAAITHRGSYAYFGTGWSDSLYANNTSFENFFTGAVNFTVKKSKSVRSQTQRLFQHISRNARMGVYSKRWREMQAGAFARISPGGSGGRQRVGKGDKHLRGVGAADHNFAWVAQKAREEIVMQEMRWEDNRLLVEVEAIVVSDQLDLRWRAKAWRNANRLSLLTR